MNSDAGTFAQVVAGVIGIMNAIIPVLIAFALVAFMVTMVKFVFDKVGGHKQAQRKEAILWSLVALAVLFSIWGLMRLVLDTFLPGANTPRYQETWVNYPVPLDNQ